MSELPSHHESPSKRKGLRARITGLLTSKTATTEAEPARQEARVSPEVFAAKMRRVKHGLPDLGLHLTLTGEADEVFRQQHERVQKRLLARVAVGDTERLQNLRQTNKYTDLDVYALPEALEQRFGKKIAIKELTPEARTTGARGSDLEGQFRSMQFLSAKQTERYPDGIEGVFRFAEVYGYMKQLPTDERPADQCKEWLIMERIEGNHARSVLDPLYDHHARFSEPITYISLTGEQASLSRIVSPADDDLVQNAIDENRFQNAIARRLTSSDARAGEIKDMLWDLAPRNMLTETKPDGTTGFVAIDMGRYDAPRR